jgi:hypothetical protein
VFAKLAVIILTIGAVAATLLAARQQRLYAVHESAEAMRRIAEHDRTLWRLRGEIADRVTPDNVKKMADRFGPLAFLFSERSSSLAAGPGGEAKLRRAAKVSEPATDGEHRRESADAGMDERGRDQENDQ